MKRLVKVLAACLFIACAGSTVAQAQFSIRFFDKKVYYPDTPVLVKVTLLNESSRSFHFKLAENRMFSIAFDARTPSNRLIDRADSYKRALASSEKAFYREMTLEPGEEYSFIEDLHSYLALSSPGIYLFQAKFYPELMRDSGTSEFLQSNSLTLDLRPGSNSPLAMEAARATIIDILKTEHIPPDEVVRRTIIARQRGAWAEFFLYLDVESLLSRDPEKKRIYDRESDDGRRRIIERYRIDLEQRVVDSDIVVIPTEFRILETKYAETSGSVRVLAKFQYDGFKMLKEYTYQLKKRDDIWYIVDYTVINTGTE